MNQKIKNMFVVGIVSISLCSVILPSLSQISVYANDKTVTSVSLNTSTVGKQKGVPFDRGSCGEFANVPEYHNRYCKRTSPPNRKITEKERNCAIALLGSSFGILAWSNPITWKHLVSTYGPAVLGCLLG